jgi:molybdate transport system ATP-binding protein
VERSQARWWAVLALIALRDVNVHVNGHRALTGISWELEPGQHWAFTGPNGSGKSTLLRVVRGDQWIDPDGGTRTYHFDGGEQTALRATGFIGFVSPEQHERYVRLELPIVGRNVIESGFDDSLYVHRALEGDDARAVDAIVARLDLGAIAAKRVRALSFGQLRRLLIARALVRRPRVLVLDEFTNGLDARARAEVLALLDEIAPQVQLLLASHRESDFIGAITHHAQLAGGRLVASGPGRPAPRPRQRATTAGENGAGPHGEALVAIAHADVYRGATPVLHDLNWSIRRGEHTALVGENGTGKSTFASVVAGTLSPAWGGDIRRSGQGGPFDVWRIKASIAHVSEEWQIAFDVNHTVEEVILGGFVASVGLFHEPDAAQRELAAALIDELGIAPLRARRFRELSFGERRKVLIARALVRPPALLILDEVWNGLDAAYRERLEAHLHSLACGGTTLLLIAHHADDLPALIVRRQRLADGVLSAADEAGGGRSEAAGPTRAG